MTDAAAIVALAAFVAQHALVLLFALVLVLLAAGALAWRLIERGEPRLFALAARSWHRLDRGRLVARYLGAHALAGLAIATAGTAAFLELTEVVGGRGALAAFDQALAAALARQLGPATQAAFAAITHLGDGAVLWTIALLVGAALLWRGERRLALAWALTTGGGALLNTTLKQLFARSRPLHDPVTLVTHGYSFPSGHASGSLLVYGTLAYLLVRHLPARQRAPVAALALVLVVLVGASRVLLQVHWFSDVLAGWANAAAWAALCIAGLEALRLAPAAGRDGPGARPIT